MTAPERSELGSFLRSRRERLSPAAVGLGAGRRRRTPGLRREEVAELAGISVDWYIRLEQGRTVSPSPATIEALARALQMGTVDRAHLQALARNRGQRRFARETVPDPIRRLLDGLVQPAYVTGRRWDILAWNAAAVDLLGDFGRIAEADRNVLIFVLTHPNARRLFGDGWAEEARRIVAQFRATHDLWAGDPAFLDLLQRLRQGCREFDGWWEAHDIGEASSGRKHLHHRTRGLQQFEYASFQSNDDPALKLVIYTSVAAAS